MLLIEAIDDLEQVVDALSVHREVAQFVNMLSSKLIDELGFLPIDQFGTDGLFQVISRRYEHGSTVITSSRAFKHCRRSLTMTVP